MPAAPSPAAPAITEASAPAPVAVDSNAPGHAVNTDANTLPRLLERSRLDPPSFHAAPAYDYELDDASGSPRLR